MIGSWIFMMRKFFFIGTVSIDSWPTIRFECIMVVYMWLNMCYSVVEVMRFRIFLCNSTKVMLWHRFDFMSLIDKLESWMMISVPSFNLKMLKICMFLYMWGYKMGGRWMSIFFLVNFIRIEICYGWMMMIHCPFFLKVFSLLFIVYWRCVMRRCFLICYSREMMTWVLQMGLKVFMSVGIVMGQIIISRMFRRRGRMEVWVSCRCSRMWISESISFNDVKIIYWLIVIMTFIEKIMTSLIFI